MVVNRDNRVVVFGAGGHAKVVVATLRDAGYDVLAVYDDDQAKWGKAVGGLIVASPDEEQNATTAGIIAIGNNAARERLAAKFPTRKWASVVHPSAHVDPSVVLGPGSVVCAGAVIQADAKIGSHVIVNTGATVDHDCVVEDFAHIAPGVHLAGDVHVGRAALMGIGSAAIPGIQIGRNTVVGAGGVVTKNLPENVTAVGAPARANEKHRNHKSVAGLVGSHQPQNGNGHAIQQSATPLFAPWPFFEEDEIEAAAAVLRSGRVNYWTGKEGHLFESEFASFVGCDHAIALANGTLALELALYSLGIGPGDEVIVPSRTFIASASCIVARGATPVVADIDPISQNITAKTIEAVLSPKTKAIIVVHLAGWPCDMDPILGLARSHGLKVIEDCAQALGATYHGRNVGSLGDVAAFSFCQDKILTTGGEGGMLTTNSVDIWDLAWSYKDHGKSWDAVHRRDAPGLFRWLHESFGSNYRITEMQAAIGRVALRKVPQWIEKRRANAKQLEDVFSQIPALRLTIPPSHIGHSFYKYYAFVQPELLADGWSRDRILKELQSEDIPCGSGSCSEIYREVAFQRNGWAPSEPLPIARELGDTSLMFVVHPTLSQSAIEAICKAVRKVFAAASPSTREATLTSR
jgi:sugar O-acyltransferase (sialic acid O-acetyltransferase NeuD family)